MKFDIDLAELANVDTREPMTRERFWQEAYLSVLRNPSAYARPAKDVAGDAVRYFFNWRGA